MNDDDDLRVGILTGRGNTFCSGMDLEDLKKLRGDEELDEWAYRALNTPDLAFTAWLKVNRPKKPIILAVEGHALAEGTKRAGAEIGKNAADYAVEIKGLEVPLHDPRAYHGFGLAYATATRGGCHLNDMTWLCEQGFAVFPEIGLPGGYTARGLQADGRPSKEKLLSLGLHELAGKLYK